MTDTGFWNTAARELNRACVLTGGEEERWQLARERVTEIADEMSVEEPYRSFFTREAAFLSSMYERMDQVSDGSLYDLTLDELRVANHADYEDILPENYGKSFGNPTFAASVFGRDMGQLISFLYMECRGAVVWAYEARRWDMLVTTELFLEIYRQFEDFSASGTQPSSADAVRRVRETLCSWCRDYCMDFMDQRTREALDPGVSFAADLIMNGDLTDLRSLYFFGEYVTPDEERLSSFLSSLPQEEVARMAGTFTNGYRLGFEAEHKDMSKKRTVNIRYRTGFEQVVRQAVLQFADMGLESVIYRSATHAVNRRQHLRIGYYGAIPNPQFEYDHRNDAAVFLDDAFVSDKLRALQCAYEHYRNLAFVHGGPAVMDVFGEKAFAPAACPDAIQMTPDAQRQQVRYNNEAGQITNRFIKGEDRSFTIIAWPVTAIGEKFEEIFHATEEINNLDYRTYQRIQQKIIDVLDTGTSVHVKGMNGNTTDITVALHELTDPSKQTNFENCVADVNIPVGEVFTSPRLKGTTGTLFVSRVYLEELHYENLRIEVKDGLVTGYGCTNFDSEEENRRYIQENILYHHPTVPVGEFAIGTNTTAYRMAQKYNIASKLPILIAEKMGPHFAFGDTCYSWQEDLKVYNPDGKEIIARDNEVSIMRKKDISAAYFGCHTDITIPYEELGLIEVVRPDGTAVPIIEKGRFVLPGTEELNRPLDAATQ